LSWRPSRLRPGGGWLGRKWLEGLGGGGRLSRTFTSTGLPALSRLDFARLGYHSDRLADRDGCASLGDDSLQHAASRGGHLHGGLVGLDYK
jgi:hypothetical protein